VRSAFATKSGWDQRIQRAEELSQSYPFAAEILSFYREIALFQKALYSYLESSAYTPVESTGRLPENWDVFALLPHFKPFLDVTARTGPKPLAQLASELSDAGPNAWEQLLADYWEAEHADNDRSFRADSFFAHAFFQPYAEYLSSHADPRANYTLAVCPFCSRKPALGILRPEGDGAKRSLLCSFCGTEWEFRRILCPACGEQDVEKLPIYTASEFEHIRVEACDSCEVYIKTVDLTKNGRAVPVVDELAAIPLSLWAAEKGYTKLQANLLGT
jgi:FdhE protein